MSFDRHYFSRQLALDGFGDVAQRRLSRSSVLVAGLGGTGCIAALNLRLAGVGHLSLLDRDVISTENLHRQPLYSSGDVGSAKAEVAAAFLSRRGSPLTEVEYRLDSLDPANARRLLGSADLAVDCLDNLPARLALNRACVERGVPLVHTGATGWDASAGVFWSPASACLECLFPSGSDEPLPSCEEAGALAPITSQAASAGSLEALKILAGLSSSLVGRMAFFDGSTGESRLISVAKRPDCGACGSPRSEARRDTVVQLCGGGEFYVARAFEPRSFSRVTRDLKGATCMGDSLVKVELEGLEVSLFRSGGVLVKGASSHEEVRGLLRELKLRGSIT